MGAVRGRGFSHSAVQRERTSLDNEVKVFTNARTVVNDSLELLEMAGDDASVVNDIDADVKKVDTAVRRLELARMLGGETDKNNAFVTLSVGQGGGVVV